MSVNLIGKCTRMRKNAVHSVRLALPGVPLHGEHLLAALRADAARTLPAPRVWAEGHIDRIPG